MRVQIQHPTFYTQACTCYMTGSDLHVAIMSILALNQLDLLILIETIKITIHISEVVLKKTQKTKNEGH